VTPEQTTASGGSSSTTSTIRDELADDASRLGSSAKERATAEAETRKQQVTQTARSTSSALGRAADQLDQDDSVPGWLSTAFRQTASGIERLAGNLEGRSPEQMAGDVTRFARESPVPFLAASAAAGFAAARFLRAGADYKHEQARNPQGGAGGSAGSSYGGNTLGGTGTAPVPSSAGYGSTPSTGTVPTGTGYGSTGGYGTSTSSTEPAGYGSNPIQGDPA